MPYSHLFTLKIGGEAGQGIKSVGLIFSKIVMRSGYHMYNYIEYPSLIRGGHNVMQTTVSPTPFNAPVQHTTMLIAMNQDTVNKHKHELVKDGGIIFDSEKGIKVEGLPNGVNAYPVPLKKLAEEAGGNDLMSNIVALGAVLGLTSGNLEHLFDLIEEIFGKKGEKIVASNQKGAKLAYDYVVKNFKEEVTEDLKPREVKEKLMVVNANEAAAQGAIAAGLQFAAIYPMTPATNILHNLAPQQEKHHFVYKQPEDEIAAINMAIGAANAGARSMVATSGGGFCLMAEGYGLAGIAEVPVVIIDAMRGGPATGIPTWNEQSDLRLALHAHQGDFPRIVLAAGDPKETFELTMQAFNLAEKYQTTVLLIIDKLICENDQSYPAFDYSQYKIDRGKYINQKQEGYERYKLSEDGISVRSPMGVGNFFIANSDEHDPQGLSNEEIDNRNAQVEKRMQKLKTCASSDMPEPQLFGPEQADVTIVSWGSNKGSIVEAIKHYDNVNFLHITWMNPFPAKAVYDRLSKAKYIINVEQNIGKHMAGLIREKTGIEILDHILKYDGRPIYPEEVEAKVNKVLGR